MIGHHDQQQQSNIEHVHMYHLHFGTLVTLIIFALHCISPTNSQNLRIQLQTKICKIVLQHGLYTERITNK